MMISPISFRAISTDPNRKLMEDVIAKPQAFVVQEDALASTSVSEKPKKGKFGKVLLAIVAVGGALAACAWGAKNGKFEVTEGGNKIINGAKNILGKVGNTVVNLFSKKGPGAVEDLAEDAAEAAKKAAEAAASV